MLRARLPLLLALLAALVAPGTLAQEAVPADPDAPEVVVLINGFDIAGATRVGTAIPLDPDAPANLSLAFTPKEPVRIRSVTVGLVVSGPGSDPPPLLSKQAPANSNLVPGFTGYLNTSADLSPIKKLGAGVFLLAVRVGDDANETVFEQEFYIRVPGGASSILTAQGATVTALSVATGYGLWQVLKDAKELRDAYDRHRKRAEERRRRLTLDVVGVAESVVERTLEKTGRPAAEVVSIHRAAGEAEKKFGPLRWTATGLGLGGVTMAWLQFLGYFAFDVASTLITALEVAAGGLTVALIANALMRRWKKAAETRTLVPADGAAAASPAPEAEAPRP